METTITDNGASIKLTIGAQIRNIAKSQIVEIAVIKTNIIKIDIRMGALYNIYIPFANVTSPITANAEALRDAINNLLPSTSGGGAGLVGAATETKQNQEIQLLGGINTELQNVKGVLNSMNDQTLNEPLLVDDGGVGIIYKGYAAIGTASSDLAWAIQRIERKGDVNVTTWANGNSKLINRWDDRELLKYI